MNADDILVPFTKEEKLERGFKPGPYPDFVFAPMISPSVANPEATLSWHRVDVNTRHTNRIYFLNIDFAAYERCVVDEYNHAKCR